MTTIAWDGKTLAVDSRATTSGVIRSDRVKKLWKIGDEWIAVSGRFDETMLVVEWIRAGRPQDRKPTLSEDFGAMILRRKKLYRIESKLAEWPIDAPFAAGGSGFEIALGAMAAGADAVTAVKIASRFDTGTGGRVRASR